MFLNEFLILRLKITIIVRKIKIESEEAFNQLKELLTLL